MDVYVGNLSNDVTEADLQEAFGEYGDVSSVIIMKDRISSNPLGFAFVEMPYEEHAFKAMEALNRTRIKDRFVMVSGAARRVERRMASKVSEDTTV